MLRLTEAVAAGQDTLYNTHTDITEYYNPLRMRAEG